MELVLNWLWQGFVVVLGTEAVLGSTRRLSAATQSAVWGLALGLVFALPLGSMAGSVAVAAAEGRFGRTLSADLPQLPGWMFTCLCLAWLCWIVATLLRTARAVAWLRRARLACGVFPSDCECRLLQWGRLKHTGRRPRLVVCDRVRAAAAFGLRNPVIAVSPALLDHLDDEDLDRVVIHEWAHVQRRDDAGRWVQVVAHIVAGFHPAVWWINRRWDLARELACDARVVELTGNPKAYAASLTKLAAQSLGADSVLVAGVLSASPLAVRVQWLLDRRRNACARTSLVALMSIAAVLLPLTCGVASVALVSRPESLAANRPVSTRRSPVADSIMALSSPASGHPLIDSSGRSVRSPRQAPTRPPGRSVLPTAERSASESVASDAVVPVVEMGVAEVEPAVVVPLIAATPVTLAVAVTWRTAGATRLGDIAERRGMGSALSAATDAGMAIGRGSQQAAAATAGVFTGIGKTITDTFSK